MSTQTLRDFPHLPLLSFEQSMSVFKLAGISFNMLSSLLGISRQSVYLWRRGRNPQPLAAERVSTLAYRALACLRDKTLPMGKRPKIAAVQAALEAVDLHNRKAEELLPKAWLPQAEQ